MTRRDALRRLILTLLTLVFGPGILKLIDRAALERVVDKLEPLKLTITTASAFGVGGMSIHVLMADGSWVDLKEVAPGQYEGTTPKAVAFGDVVMIMSTPVAASDADYMTVSYSIGGNDG